MDFIAESASDAPENLDEAFRAAMRLDVPGGSQCVVTLDSHGAPRVHRWIKPGEPFPAPGNTAGVYFGHAAFSSKKVSQFRGRTKENVISLRAFFADIDVGKGGGYDSENELFEALKTFVTKHPDLLPSFVVASGSGGMHLWWILDRPLDVLPWSKTAETFKAMLLSEGLKIDAQCTTDAARIARMPGSIHQKTGQRCTVVSRPRTEPYTLEEIQAAIGAPDVGTCATDSPDSVGSPKYDLSVNADITEAESEHARFSYAKAALRCGALAKAAEKDGRDTLYPVWFLAIRAAALSIDGVDYAHKISSGHADYDRAFVDKKLVTLSGGPAGCETWASAYGRGAPCDSCSLRGKIKNPAIQLGSVPVEPVVEQTPGYIAELNKRYATVRYGSKIVVADFQTPSFGSGGVTHGVGFMDLAALVQKHRGQFAPRDGGGKSKPLATAWLEHPERRQFEGLTFAPGETVPDSMLNLWQGFAVEPTPGDVSLWLEVLDALVPNDSDRHYVRNWLAWKVQNPGGVPDTVLIFTGAKGTGKNSLFDPLLTIFGKHTLLAVDPELIAGRFTWHLMTTAFAVLDEAVFMQDPRQADRIKSRVTAKVMTYEQKGMDPVQGENHCAYVMLTNHQHVWQASLDERRAVVISAGEALRGRLDFWKRYHAWVAGTGPAALLHHLQQVDISGFNPRAIPKNEALRQQVALTALRDPAAAWWCQCLNEGEITWRENGIDRSVFLAQNEATLLDRAALRHAYEQSASARGAAHNLWPTVAKKITAWSGPDGIRQTRRRDGTARVYCDVLPPLITLRKEFTKATQIIFEPET